MEGIAMMKLTRYPTPAELDAIERAARRARAEAIAGFLVAAARGLKTLVARCAAALAIKPQGTDSSMRRGA